MTYLDDIARKATITFTNHTYGEATANRWITGKNGHPELADQITVTVYYIKDRKIYAPTSFDEDGTPTDFKIIGTSVEELNAAT